jgi:hypothetical protein
MYIIIFEDIKKENPKPLQKHSLLLRQTFTTKLVRPVRLGINHLRVVNAMLGSTPALQKLTVETYTSTEVTPSSGSEEKKESK